MTTNYPAEAPVVSTVEETRALLPSILPRLVDVAADIHAHPEIRFTEVHAAARVISELESAGFSVEREFAGLETAFLARWSTPGATEESPTIAIFCEYDALEEIGHACGHNIIAAAGLGAGLITKSALEPEEYAANVLVVGSPGEEGSAGKVPMIEGGVLDGVDLAIMVHPGGEDMVGGTSLSRVAMDVEFRGRASHAAAAPELGRNALDAATLGLTAVGLLRQQLTDDVRVHGIITDGGQAPNIIPERTSIRAFVRAGSRELLQNDVLPRVQACFEGAAIASGCEVSIAQNTPPYFSLVSNPVLVGLAEAAYRVLGREPISNGSIAGSTDMGNVSHVVPSIHPIMCIEPGLAPHTREFAEAAGGPSAEAVISDGAVMLATVALAVIRDPKLLAAAKHAFQDRFPA